MSSSSTIILITGANSGVGYATAKVIASASQNYHIIIASRNSSKGTTALKELEAITGIKGTLSFVELDVTSPSSVAAAAKEVEGKFGRLDILINNAGVFTPDTYLPERTELDATFQTNVIGPAVVTETFLPLLKKSQKAYLLYITSALGSLGKAADPEDYAYAVTCTAYRMSKSALNMMMVEDSKRLGKEGIKVFAICPGLVESNLRGTGEAQRTAGGAALSADTSGETILAVVEGKRDGDVGKTINQAGVIPW